MFEMLLTVIASVVLTVLIDIIFPEPEPPIPVDLVKFVSVCFVVLCVSIRALSVIDTYIKTRSGR